MKKLLTTIATLAVTAVAATAAFGFSACGDNDDVTKTSDPLIVYTEPGFAPFEYEADDGSIVGVDVDIMNLVGEKLGKEVIFESVSFDTIIPAVSAGKLCHVGAAGISITPEREEKVAFSTEYYTAKLYVIYKVSEASNYVYTPAEGEARVYWSSLEGKNIAVQGGTTADMFIGDEISDGVLTGSGAVLTPYEKLAFAVADVKLNMDVLVIDELPAKQLIAGDSSLACAPLYYQGEDGEEDEAAEDVYAICVNKKQKNLLNAINEVLAELGDDGVQALVNKHLGITD